MKIINALRWIGAAILPMLTGIVVFFAAMFFGHLISWTNGERLDKLLFFVCNVSAGFCMPHVAFRVAPQCKRTACIVISTVYASIYGIYAIKRALLHDWHSVIMEVALMTGIIAAVISICREN